MKKWFLQVLPVSEKDVGPQVVLVHKLSNRVFKGNTAPRHRPPQSPLTQIRANQRTTHKYLLNVAQSQSSEWPG